MRWYAVLIVLLLGGPVALRAADGPDWKERTAKLESAQGAELEELKKALVSGGMPAHAALKDGSESTAAVRAELRKAIRQQRDAAARAKGLVMHEWGAIGYLQGQDDARIDAPREESSDLPEFVQVWSKLAQQALPENVPGGIRIEIIRKPIVYFYSDQFETVTFVVKFPHGMPTEWFPKAWEVEPKPGVMDVKAAMAQQAGGLRWKNFDLQPGAQAPLPAVPDKAWWWPICRDTDSTPINVDGVLEKFLFYRGLLTDVPPVVKVDGGEKQRYTLTNTAKKEAVRHLMMVNVSGGKAFARYVPSLAAGEKLPLEMTLPADAKPVEAFAEEMRQRLAEALEEEGLFPKESAGMTRIWRRDWFETDGVRLIYLNPPGATSDLLPISIDPRPVQQVRTMVMAIECLKDSRDNVIKELVEQLGDGNYATREAAQKQLMLLGKQTEPALKAALKKADDEEVRNRITRILNKLNPRTKVEADEKDKPDQGDVPGIDQ